MFEKTEPLVPAHLARDSGGKAAHSELGTAGESLRPIEWQELTARLNAARDYRLILRRDVCAAPTVDAGLADAATRYFRTKDDNKRVVNPVALGGSKASPGILHPIDDAHGNEDHNRGHAEQGDARED